MGEARVVMSKAVTQNLLLLLLLLEVKHLTRSTAILWMAVGSQQVFGFVQLYMSVVHCG